MQLLMQRWIGLFERLLEERSGAALTVAPGDGQSAAAARVFSNITMEGALRGVLRVVVSEEELVQFVQLARRQPLDAQQVLDAPILGEWRALLEESAARLAGQLLADEVGETTVLLREVQHAAEDNTLALWDVPGAEGASYVIGAGQIALHLILQSQVEVSQTERTERQAAQLEKKTGTTPGNTARAQSRPAPETASATADAADSAAASGESARTAWQGAGPAPGVSGAFRDHPERLDLLLDIELEASLRFGAVELPLRQVLELGPGDVLQLDRHVQEPVDLVVGDRIVARGEVVVVAGNFGLHVTEVAEPRRRLETIRCLF